MNTEKEIMRKRNRKAVLILLLSSLFTIMFLSSIQAGTFDDLKTLNATNEENCCDEVNSNPITEQPKLGNNPNGEKLFKANCSACHIPWTEATGPALKGARDRWIENSSEENFYKFIKNSQKVIDSGDPYANKLYNKYQKTRMNSQNLSNEDIDDIFEYIEG
ncbi:MAG: c-type cytochrome [Crocinitomicaceae bacterium]|nr:c-type cytochrome [Crocinitomicaceae bacterium]